ncbi:hypothetical protein LUZ60_015956 [Juncus effusus]|nr:hypothetical protein LUZ60_015956 [Juncus effusus]
MDWAELNRDALFLISKKLGDILNFIWFRAVCKNWRLVVGPHDCPPQLPWFIEYQAPYGSGDSSYRKFFSLYSQKIHTLHIPAAKGKVIFGTTNRYFLTHDYRHFSASLFNPLSRFYFPIPLIKEFIIRYPIYIRPDSNPNPNPDENGGVVVVYRGEEGGRSPYMVFRRFVDGQLTEKVEIEVPCPNPISFSQGRLFVFDRRSAETRVFDVTTGNEVQVISSPSVEFVYLIEACGDLLGVVKKFMNEKWQFEVYRLEDASTDFRWVKMTKGIGDRMLFLDGDNPGCGLCLKASDFEGFSGNCIYFLTWSHGGDYGHNLMRYELESMETQAIPNPRIFSGTWFVPSLY